MIVIIPMHYHNYPLSDRMLILAHSYFATLHSAQKLAKCYKYCSKTSNKTKKVSVFVGSVSWLNQKVCGRSVGRAWPSFSLLKCVSVNSAARLHLSFLCFLLSSGLSIQRSSGGRSPPTCPFLWSWT